MFEMIRKFFFPEEVKPVAKVTKKKATKKKAVKKKTSKK